MAKEDVTAIDKKISKQKNYSQTVVIRKGRRSYASITLALLVLLLKLDFIRRYQSCLSTYTFDPNYFGVGIGFLFKERAFELETELSGLYYSLAGREGEEMILPVFYVTGNSFYFDFSSYLRQSTLGIGYLAKAVLPASVPLSACPAIGAALGPTDLVALFSYF